MTKTYLPWHPQNAEDTDIRVRDDKTEYTGVEFNNRVSALAQQLAEHGVQPGDVIATFLPNQLELLTALAAAWRIGAAATPMNPMFTAKEAAYQASDSGAKLVITTDEVAEKATEDYFPGAEVLALSQLRTQVDQDTTVFLPEVQPEDIALVIYTSGSTGRPKGVLLSHANIDAMSAQMQEAMSVRNDAHALVALPLFHVNALLVSFLTPFRAGGKLTIMERFKPEPFARRAEEVQATYFSGVPALFAHLLQLPEDLDIDLSSFEFALCGAAPASIELINNFRARFGTNVISGYGLTEATCASTVTRPDDRPREGSVGRAMPGQEIRISDGEGGFAPTGVAGEVLVKGPTVMVGYLNKEEATKETLRDGWLHTGDVGYLDEDGFLTLVDRLKDMIIRGGENLYPSEIEHVLCTHDFVSEAAVVGAPHDILGEVPVAYVTASAAGRGKLTAELLDELIQAELTKVKWPQTITIVDEFPRNPVGKIDKPGLRAMAKDAATSAA